jgi:hypothetical protein
VQSSLKTILLRFRSQPYAAVGDIKQMYPQVRVGETAKYQKILWREEPNEQIKVYQLDTVTFSTTPAAYLPTQSLNHSSEFMDNKKLSKCICEDFYIDDMHTEEADEKDLINKVTTVITHLAMCRMKLVKINSNSKKLVDNVPVEKKSIMVDHQVTSNRECKSLGMFWNISLDTFSFKFEPRVEIGITKRSALIQLASLFDLLGLVTPCIIAAKLTFSDICPTGIS